MHNLTDVWQLYTATIFSGKHSDRQFHRPEQAIDTASRSMKALTVSLFKSTAPPTFHVHSLNFIQISSILTRRQWSSSLPFWASQATRRSSSTQRNNVHRPSISGAVTALLWYTAILLGGWYYWQPGMLASETLNRDLKLLSLNVCQIRMAIQ